MKQLPVPGDQFTLTVDGDTLAIATKDGVVLHRHDCTFHQKCPWWEGLEGFCDYAGDGLRVALVTLDIGDRLIHIYDHRPAFYPLISDIADPEQRASEEAARREEPELYGPNGECLEWQQGGNFAYVWNLDTDYFSEWGSAPFPQAGESHDEMNARLQANLDSWREAFGPADFVEIVGPQVATAIYPRD